MSREPAHAPAHESCPDVSHRASPAPELFHVHRQSAYLIGRDRIVRHFFPSLAGLYSRLPF